MRITNLLLIFVLFLTSACAKKATMKYAEQDTLQTCEENFYKKYYMFLSKEEQKELIEIKTLSECEIFLNRFWSTRDIDPTTTENEFKNLLEKRASDIELEILFSNPGSTGFFFKNNNGFSGDPARVYMLHGSPDYIETLQNGATYVDLMIWIYLDEKGNHKFRFLFYNKNNHITYILLRPGFEMIYGLEEINKNPNFTHPTDIYDELSRNGKYIFLLSLMYFSDDPSLNVDKVLRPPKPAAEIAKDAAPRISGELPEKENIVASNGFEALIPAEFFYEIVGENLFLKIPVRHENLDWVLNEKELTTKLFIKILAWSDNNSKELEEKTFDIVSTKEKIAEKKSIFTFEANPIKLSKKPMRISVYIKNNNKYNAWVEEIKR